MRRTQTALLMLVILGLITPASAQQPPPPGPPPPAARPAQPPPALYDSWGRGPPVPHGRQYVGPGSQVAPPMPRTEPVAPLSPRIGN
jgi:hypothetical protein